MNPITIAIAGVLFIVGLVVGRTTTETNNANSVITQESTPSATPIEESTASPSSTIAISPINQETPEPTRESSNAVSQPSTQSFNDFVYPGSTTNQSSPTAITLTSNDDVQTITNWYEQKIQSFGSKAAAKTNSNGKVENKISASKNGETISITIRKTPSSSEVTIEVSLSKKDSNENNVRIEIHNEQNTAES